MPSSSMLGLLVLAIGLGGGLAPAREDDGPMPDLGQTWVEVNGQTYGAKPDALGPIGGGSGYMRIVTSGQHTVKTMDELRAALGKAQAGEVIFIDSQAELDLATLRQQCLRAREARGAAGAVGATDERLDLRADA